MEVTSQNTARGGPDEGSSLRVLGELVTSKVTAEQTGGLLVFEATSRSGGVLPPHIQHCEDESFYVLEDEFGFLGNGCTIRAGAGSLVYVPKGNLHTYKNVGTTPGKMLVSQTPGGLHERFFEEIGQEAQDKFKPMAHEGLLDVERIVAIAAMYGIEIPPPTF